ncbi:MAG: ubiquinol-cytochrome C chaperone family protein [Hyphomicrobiales bacterium]
MIKLWSRNASQQQAADTIYAAIVAQARHPGFYRDAHVPDSIDGRFDLLVLHAFLFLRRLKGEGEAAGELGQLVFDTMFADLDQNLREMGVGDLGIAKRVRKMASAFYGRTAAYDEALDGYGADPEALEGAVKRNMFPESDEAPGAGPVAAYMAECDRALAAQETARLLEGTVSFPEPAFKLG